MLAGIGLDLLSVVGTAAMPSRTFTISASAINFRDAWSSVSTTRLPCDPTSAGRTARLERQELALHKA